MTALPLLPIVELRPLDSRFGRSLSCRDSLITKLSPTMSTVDRILFVIGVARGPILLMGWSAAQKSLGRHPPSVYGIAGYCTVTTLLDGVVAPAKVQDMGRSPLALFAGMLMFI
jgi:hypothetical protein